MSPKNKCAAPGGNRNGAEDDVKADNLQTLGYLERRLAAIATRFDPHHADLNEIDALIALADNVLGDAP